MSLFQHPTVRRLVDATSSRPAAETLLYRLSAPSAVPAAATVVAIPFGGGTPAAFRELSQALPPHHPLYAVDLPGHDPLSTAEFEPFDAIAARLRDEIGPLSRPGAGCVTSHWCRSASWCR